MDNNKEYELKVDGKENTFEGGAIRYSKNKGRFDLIPTNVLRCIIDTIEKQPDTLTVEVSVKELLKYISLNDYVNAILQISCLYNGACYNNTQMTSKSFKTNKTHTMKCFVMSLKDLAIHFQKGAEKYGERNCEKGIPLWSFIDSGFRHTCQFILCETDEPHYVSAIWNFWMAQWTIMKNPLQYMPEINICRTHKVPSITKEVLNKAYDLSGNINETDYTILNILKELSDETDAVIVTAKQKVDETSDNTTENEHLSENAANEYSNKDSKDGKEVDKPANVKITAATSSEKSESQSIMDESKSIFTELNIPVVTGHQLNKEDDLVVLKVLKQRTPKVSSHTIGVENFDPDEEKKLKAFIEKLCKLAESHTFNFNE